MKESAPIIYLRELAGEDTLFGNEDGRKIYNRLLDEIDSLNGNSIFCISLKGIKATDASFPRESVISAAKMKKGEVGFFLVDFRSQDLIDNWNYGCIAKEQPLIVYQDNCHRVLGPPLPETASELLDYVIQQGTVTTSLIADEFDVTPQNASGRLKKLHDLGLIMGKKEVANSGGLEFVYCAIQ